MLQKLEQAEKELDELNKSFPEKIMDSITKFAIEGNLSTQNINDQKSIKIIEAIKERKKELKKAGIKMPKDREIIKKDTHFYEGATLIDDELIFDIPDYWELVRLGNLCSKISDGTHKTPEYTDEGIPFLSVQNISSGRFSFSPLYISPKHIKF